MTTDLDKLSPTDALRQLDAWEAKLPGSMYTHEFIAELAAEAMPALIDMARSRLLERMESLEDPTDLDKLEKLARAATPGWVDLARERIGTVDDLDRVSSELIKVDPDGDMGVPIRFVLKLVERVRAAEAGAGAALKDAMEAFNTGGFEGACQYVIDQLAPVMDAAKGGPAVLVMGEERAAQFEAIVRDLATSRLAMYASSPCPLCGHESHPTSAFADDNHDASCVVRRAVEATR